MKNPFSILGGLLITTVTCILISIHFEANAFQRALCITVGDICYCKLAMAMYFAHGYGTKGVKMIAGMPMLLAALITPIAGISISLLMMDYQPSDLPQRIIIISKAFNWSIASGITVGICHWYFYASQAYFHQCERARQTT